MVYDGHIDSNVQRCQLLADAISADHKVMPRHPLSPPLKSTFEHVYQAVAQQPNKRTPELVTTGGVRFVAEAKETTDRRRFVSLPHSNRIYEEDWGFSANSMGKDGQRIGQYAVPIDNWASTSGYM